MYINNNQNINEEENIRYWYAILVDEDDNDWGEGSFDFAEAMETAKRRGYKYVAKIADGDDPVCEEIIEVE